jgi:hypothetical protein
MDPLSFKLKIKVPETSIVNSLISLVYERVKRINEILVEARTLEISLFQRLVGDEQHAVAEITLAHDTDIINETCESKMWDVAFLNALDQVKAKLEASIENTLT